MLNRTGKPSRTRTKALDVAVKYFADNKGLFATFAESVVKCLQEDHELGPYIQQIKYRIKSEERLRKKLERKVAKSGGGRTAFKSISALTQEINDFAGIRILHLHTTQFEKIDNCIKRVLKNEEIEIIEGPIAHCWDDDHEDFFKQLRIETTRSGSKPGPSDTMYASVHYILRANKTGGVTCELQVRTLADEIWGQVSHKVEYVDGQTNNQVHELLKVLARLTSASTRLVDCIFEAKDWEKKGRKWPSPRK